MTGTFGELSETCKICKAKIDKHRTLKIDILSVDGTQLCSLKWKAPLCSKHSGLQGKVESLQFKISWEGP